MTTEEGLPTAHSLDWHSSSLDVGRIIFIPAAALCYRGQPVPIDPPDALGWRGKVTAFSAKAPRKGHTVLCLVDQAKPRGNTYTFATPHALATAGIIPLSA